MAIHADAKLPTDAQRRGLSKTLSLAIIEIRYLAYKGKSEQAADLADAFHNLPVDMWADHFSLHFFRDSFLKVYKQKYPVGIENYVAMLDEIFGTHD
jgi:hypothetical protein